MEWPVTKIQNQTFSFTVIWKRNKESFCFPSGSCNSQSLAPWRASPSNKPVVLTPEAGPGVQQLPAGGWGKDLHTPAPLRHPSIELSPQDLVSPQSYLWANEKKVVLSSLGCGCSLAGSQSLLKIRKRCPTSRSFISKPLLSRVK